MADKDFIVKNGIVVSNNLIYATADSGEVGINTTSPTANLHVVGTGFFSTTLTANIVQANSISTNSISSSSLSLTGNMSIGGSLTVTNDLAVSRNFGVSGNTNLVGNVTIGGTTSLVNLSGTIGSFSNVNISNFGNIQTANLTNLTVSTSTNISGTATFNNAVVAGFTPTATNHLINAGYANTTFVRADGKNAFSANITISSTAPTIILNDTDHSNFRIHCNSNLAGFLKSDLNWANYTDQSGNFVAAGNISAAGNLSAAGSITAASLAGGASTGTGASGTWPINITGNAANGRTFLQEVNIVNGAGDVSFPTVFSDNSSYKFFDIEFINVVPSLDRNYLYMRFAQGGIYRAESLYSTAIMGSGAQYQNSKTVGFVTSYEGGIYSYFPLVYTGYVSNAAALSGLNGLLRFSYPELGGSAYRSCYGQINYYQANVVGNAYYLTSSVAITLQQYGAVQGFQLFWNNGTMQSGKVRVYGYKE